MSLNRILIAVICLFTLGNIPVFAQKKIKINGSVADDSTKKPIRGVKVTLHSLPDSTLIKGAITTAQGGFSLDAPANKKYTLELRRVGYAAVVQVIPPSEEDKSLPLIYLKESSIITGDVEVIGWREFTEVRPDKSVYSVKDNPNVIATTVSEVLDQIPAVQVDENGGIKLRGDDNVVIMINDKPLTMDAEQRNKMLQQLPSMNIKSVEIRTAPGAKYDAKFNGGIINIIMDKALTDYIGGNVYLGGSTTEGRNGGGTFYYNDSLITGSLNVGAYHGIYNSNTIYERNNPLSPSLQYINKTVFNEGTYTGYYTNPQIDFSLSSMDILSLSGEFNYGPGTSFSTGNGVRSNSNREITQLVKDSTDFHRSGTWMNMSLLYRHQFADNHKISIDLNHSNWSSAKDEFSSSILLSPTSVLDSVSSLQQINNSKDSNPAYNLKLDYSYAPTKALNIELGHKIETETHPSDVTTRVYDYYANTYHIDSLQTLNASPHNTLYAFYSNFGYSFSDDISIQAGARYEHAEIGGTFRDTTIDRTYPNLFPSASLSWKLSPEYQLTANYNRSIQLPWVNILNPRASRSSSTSQFVGNPDIRPEFTHSIELSANAFLGSTTITISPYYKRTVDEIKLNSVLINDIYTNSYVNYSGLQTLGVDGTFNYRTRTGFSARMNLSIQNYKNVGGTVYASDFTTESTNASANGSISYEVIKGLTLNTNARYVSPYTIGGEKALTFFFMNFGAIYKMLDNALTINLMAADPFNLQKRDRVAYGNGFSLSTDSKPLSRYFNLNISYTFGKRVNLEQHNTEKSAPRGEG
ncbi:MAG: TonB-dependent receptor [Ignavibacteriae bacterium]|nr:TonB-dependent receptor [Ignavibacteriota bacterium]